MKVGHKEIATDAEGFLRHLDDWDKTIANKVAENEGITLTEDHWKVIDFLRQFYRDYKITPAVRIVVKELTKRWGAEKGNSIYLHQLFPGGVIKQASKIAGLPKPKRCI